MVGESQGNKENLNTTKCSVTVVKCMARVGKKKYNGPECGNNETAQIIH